MPRLWTQTIETHRREVHDAILDATAALVARHGLRSVTMSQIAEGSGIGRATLYKYFADVESILLAWHERHVAGHLRHLAEIRHGARDPRERLEAVLGAYARIVHRAAGQEDADLTAVLHRGPHVPRAEERLHRMVRDLLGQAARNGEVRDDVPVEELASYCLHALGAARGLRSKAAVRRLVEITLAGLRSPST
ncbi:MAG TPA: TetR/AcrR family transcriptional regulator [Actinomycetota bacterium]|nr:TetR/AcrR family transcriptional regulator [Actinomycetota bacterium]